MNEGRFRYQGAHDSATLSTYLRALTEAFEKGEITLAQGEARIVMSPSGLVNLTVEGKRGEGKGKLTLKLTWRESNAPAGDDEDPLVIECPK